MARAGRFGTKGLAITFVSDENDAKILNDVQDRFEVNISELPDEIDISSYSEYHLCVCVCVCLCACMCVCTEYDLKTEKPVCSAGCVPQKYSVCLACMRPGVHNPTGEKAEGLQCLLFLSFIEKCNF